MFQTVLIEEQNGGPVEFKVAETMSGELHWKTGRFVLSGRPCVRLTTQFARRLREAMRLQEESKGW